MEIGKELRMENKREKVVGPGIKPPLWLAAGLGLVLLSRVFNVPGRAPKAARFAGFPLMALGFGLGGSAAATQRHAGTSVNPNHPSQAIVQTGPYRFTRNPIYLGMAMMIAGASLAFNALWALFYVPVFLVAMDRGMVRREEEYLEKRFGRRYDRYREQVRRWI
jgi:protein-S-isoprenylcysteine O-methyltransferase Ste14